MTHFAAHPVLWARYLWGHELRHREVRFEQNPRFADWRPEWRVSRGPLGRALGIAPTELDPFFGELGPLHARLVAEAGPVPSAGALMQAPLLYVIVRALRPQWIVETGISSGYSARLMLEAIRTNGSGHLDSIGVDNFGIVAERSAEIDRLKERRIGWLVPEELRSAWKLHVGTSQEQLPPLLAARSGPLELFLHDSLHQYATMHWEYTTAWPRIPPGGILASHDVHANRAWPEFLGAQGLAAAGADLDHDLGVVRRPVAR